MRAVRIAHLLVSSLLLCLVSSAVGQPFWSQYGGNPQHTAEVTTGVQDMNQILWQTPEDLYPPGDGSDLYIHYASPVISNAGTVVVTVRNGPNDSFPSSDDTFQIEGHDLGIGTTLWTQSTDFTDWMPHDWIPSCGSALDSNNKVYTPGAGGTVWVRSSADSASATVTQECFYGLSNYTANESACNSNVQICTPITVDSSNNIYFGFYVTSGWSSGNPVSLASGIAKISPTGVGTWVSASQASSISGDEVATNATPAISNDGKYVYIAVKEQGPYSYNNPQLLRLNTSDLSTASEVNLQGPSSTFAYILDDGTASPMVGPDGDVFFGVWYSVLASRGFMLHYSADLSTSKPAGAFGWDDTASVVPASAVPSYTGTSSYLILSKYNNYADPGCWGDGLNKVAILDPDNTESYTVQFGPDYNPPNATGPTYTCMNEVLTILGPTSNVAEDLPGVREWCINMAAIDVAGKSAVINSEDGHAYRWDFTTNTLTQSVNLNPPIGEAYTPTVVGPQGVSFAVNNASLYAIWDGITPSGISGATITGGTGTTETLTLSGNATGPGATVKLSSSNPNVQVPTSVLVPAGSDSVTFNVTSTAVSSDQTATITANRFGFTATGTTKLIQPIHDFYVTSPSITGGTSTLGVVQLPSNGGPDTVGLSSNSPYISIPTSVTVPSTTFGVSFTINSTIVSAPLVVTLTATLSQSSLHTTLTLNPYPISNFYTTATSISAGGSTLGVVQLSGKAGNSGDKVTLSSGNVCVQVPPSTTVPANGTGVSFTVTTSAVAASVNVTLTATLGTSTKQTVLTVIPPMISNFYCTPSIVASAQSSTGVVQLTANAPSGGTVVSLTSSSSAATIPATVTIPAGVSGVSFQIKTATVHAKTVVTLTAKAGLSVKTTTLTILPVENP